MPFSSDKKRHGCFLYNAYPSALGEHQVAGEPAPGSLADSVPVLITLLSGSGLA